MGVLIRHRKTVAVAFEPAPQPGHAPARRAPSRRRRPRLALLGLVLAFAGAALLHEPATALRKDQAPIGLKPALAAIGAEEIATLLPGLLPLEWPVAPMMHRQDFVLTTSIDVHLQDAMDQFLAERRPGFAAVAVLDPETGAVLCLASFSRDPVWRARNLALVGSFPAASVFKLVTAAGAMAEGTRRRLDPIDFVGSRTALPADWNTGTTVSGRAHWVTLEEAFAGSINPVFGKIGQHDLGRGGLEDWAEQMGWGPPITDQLRVEASALELGLGQYSAAETGAGYTRTTTMSPLHAAALAGVVANGGRFIRPGVITSIVDGAGRVRYKRGSGRGQTVLSAEVAAELSEMMRATISYGTASNAFEKREGVLAGLDIGGKTGTLTGENPAGRCHWLVGWARPVGDGPPLAFAALVLLGGRWSGTGTMELSKRLLKAFYEPRATSFPGTFSADVRSRPSQPLGSLAQLDEALVPPASAASADRKASRPAKKATSRSKAASPRRKPAAKAKAARPSRKPASKSSAKAASSSRKPAAKAKAKSASSARKPAAKAKAKSASSARKPASKP